MSEFHENENNLRKKRKTMSAECMKTIMNTHNNGHKPADIAESLEFSLANVVKSQYLKKSFIADIFNENI